MGEVEKLCIYLHAPIATVRRTGYVHGFRCDEYSIAPPTTALVLPTSGRRRFRHSRLRRLLIARRFLRRSITCFGSFLHIVPPFSLVALTTMISPPGEKDDVYNWFDEPTLSVDAGTKTLAGVSAETDVDMAGEPSCSHPPSGREHGFSPLQGAVQTYYTPWSYPQVPMY